MIENKENLSAKVEQGKLQMLDLSSGELFLVWAVRHWVNSVINSLDPNSRLIDGCNSVSMGELARPIDNVMNLILPNTGSENWATCMGYRMVVPSETIMLRAVHWLQNERWACAFNLMQIWLRPSVTRFVMENFVDIAGVLKSRKHFFPFREIENQTRLSDFESKGFTIH